MSEVPLLTIVVPWRNKPGAETVVSNIVRPAVSEHAQVIIVDDASDGPEAAALQSLAEHEGARYVRLSEHSGPGAARNAGLCCADGLFVNFSDADDRPLVRNLIKLSEEALNQSADVAIGAYVHESHRTDQAVVRHLRGPGLSFQSALAEQPAVWRYVFSRGFLNAHGLRFPPGIYAEDLRFLLRCCESRPQVLTTTSPCYVYVDSGQPQRLTAKAPTDAEFADVLKSVTGSGAAVTDEVRRLESLWEIRIWTQWWKVARTRQTTGAVWSYVADRRSAFIWSILRAWPLLCRRAWARVEARKGAR